MLSQLFVEVVTALDDVTIIAAEVASAAARRPGGDGATVAAERLARRAFSLAQLLRQRHAAGHGMCCQKDRVGSATGGRG